MEANEDVKKKNVKSSAMEAGEGAEDFQSYKQPFFDQQKPSTRLRCAPDCHLGGKAGLRVYVLESTRHEGEVKRCYSQK